MRGMANAARTWADRELVHLVFAADHGILCSTFSQCLPMCRCVLTSASSGNCVCINTFGQNRVSPDIFVMLMSYLSGGDGPSRRFGGGCDWRNPFRLETSG
jgi:hypothetical protein